MKIKITDKVICFPPYISTTWDNVKSVRVEKDATGTSDTLVITLTDGCRIKIPNLDQRLIEGIFTAHLKFLEQNPNQLNSGNEAFSSHKTAQQNESSSNAQPGLGIPLRFGINGIEGLGAALQHNPSQSDTPPLPHEILDKVAAIAKIIGCEDLSLMPQPENNCNCVHCQIARAIHQGAGTLKSQVEHEEIVSDDDLKFRVWDITQSGEKLYNVTNPLDHNEQYSVYLGDPIGCTCGQKNCEHIKAVLNS